VFLPWTQKKGKSHSYKFLINILICTLSITSLNFIEFLQDLYIRTKSITLGIKWKLFNLKNSRNSKIKFNYLKYLEVLYLFTIPLSKENE
jgi:hypothetical protein